MYNKEFKKEGRNKMSESTQDLIITIIGWGVITILIIGFIVLTMFGLPRYNVWNAEMTGKARLAEADQSRQIMITEARAKKEAAIYEAEAEIERAKGMAKANQIVGDSLDGHANYLMYLYIQNMQKTSNQIIYIPTEGGMPILEAQRLNKR